MGFSLGGMGESKTNVVFLLPWCVQPNPWPSSSSPPPSLPPLLTHRRLILWLWSTDRNRFDASSANFPHQIDLWLWFLFLWITSQCSRSSVISTCYFDSRLFTKLFCSLCLFCSVRSFVIFFNRLLSIHEKNRKTIELSFWVCFLSKCFLF